MLFEIHITAVMFGCDMFYHNCVNKEHMTSFTHSGTKESVFKEMLKVVGEILTEVREILINTRIYDAKHI